MAVAATVLPAHFRASEESHENVAILYILLFSWADVEVISNRRQEGINFWDCDNGIGCGFGNRKSTEFDG